MPSLDFHEVAALPRLAWLAVVDPGAARARVFHGPAVECRDRWMVEGVWDGDFAAGGFHDSPHFFGSGIRVDGDRLLFVPSSALVDRVLYCEDRGRVVVSNSLVLLLAFTGARLDPAHDYRAEATAIRQGVGAYPREFVVVHPEIPSFVQVYDECLVVDHDGLTFTTLREAPRIDSYARYRDLLAETLLQLQRNYSSPERRAPMSAFVTLSSGYDSAAVAALVSRLGVETCFTARRSNSYFPRWLSPSVALDDGTPIAAALGLRTIPLDQRRARVSEDEIFFLAPGCAQPALVFHSMTRLLRQRPGVAVLFTGFQGDEVWDVTWEQPYHEHGIIRGDGAALGLSEIRLESGFINLAVPALCARRIQDIAALGVSPAMEPWRMHDGYDRPVARRIVETAGIGRGRFARRKKAVVRTYSYPVHRGLRRAFFRWLRERRGLTPTFVYLHVALNRVVFFLIRSREVLLHRLFPHRPERNGPTPHVFLWKGVDLPGLMFHWAAASLAARFAPALEEADATRPPERSQPVRHAPAAR